MYSININIFKINIIENKKWLILINSTITLKEIATYFFSTNWFLF